MLMQNFKSAADLDITEPQLSALQKTLVLLETDKLTHVIDPDPTRRAKAFTGHFSMSSWAWESSCGSVCCIGGTAELVGSLPAQSLDKASSQNRGLHNLFYPYGSRRANWGSITPAEAARALRSYLTTGDAKWHEAAGT